GLVGLVPLAAPLALHHSGLCCAGSLSCGALCLAACLGGGVVAGALVGARALAGERQRLRFFAGAGFTAWLVGAMGCTVAGTAGVLGLAVALAAGAIPMTVGAVRARP